MLNILPLLQKALRLSDNAKITKHPSGAVNDVYRVQDEGNDDTASSADYAVKWLGNDTFSGVNRTHQFVLQQQLHSLDIAPRAIWLSDDETLWVEQWQPNIKVAQAKPETLANVLARIHQLPITARPLNLIERWQHYINVANLEPNDSLYLHAVSLRSKVIKSEQDDNDLVLCHNDLLSSHVLCRANDIPVVIDWEYSAMGNRYFDLASCCLINKLSIEESTALLQCYTTILGISFDEALAKFQLHKEIVSVTNDLWFKALGQSEAE